MILLTYFPSVIYKLWNISPWIRVFSITPFQEWFLEMCPLISRVLPLKSGDIIPRSTLELYFTYIHIILLWSYTHTSIICIIYCYFLDVPLESPLGGNYLPVIHVYSWFTYIYWSIIPLIRTFHLCCNTRVLWRDTCDTFYLRLSWLVSYSDEEGNIRRMIYDDVSWLPSLTPLPTPQICWLYMYCSSTASQQPTFNSSKGTSVYSLRYYPYSLPSIMLLNNTIYDAY